MRKPDIGIIRNDNPVLWGDNDRYYAGVYDLCVEALSDSSQREVERDITTKRYEYSAAGVQEHYILDPSKENMYFYRRASVGLYEEIAPNAESVIRSEVLK